MSRFAEALAVQHPDHGIAIPEPLERAWAWCEAQGWGIQRESAYYVTPYAGSRRLGVVFDSGATLDGWFEPGAPGADRLLPFADLDSSGGVAALWRDDAGEIRVVGLGGEGEVGILAEDAVDFLRLVAIGYDEVGNYLDGPPEDEEAREAHAPFRAFVAESFGVEVPEHWHYAEPDPFNAWVAQVLGEEYAAFR